MDGITIRIADTDDACAILDIYRHYVEHSSITFEYELPSIEEYRSRMETILSKYPFIVCEIDGKVAGYAYASVFRSRAAYAWAVETSIYVDPGMHRKGIGSALYRELEKILKKQNIRVMYACIAHPSSEKDEMNESESFHEKIGFSIVGRFHDCGYKFGMPCDIVWMEKHLIDSDEPLMDVIPFDRSMIA